MKAIVNEIYGSPDVLKISEVPKPIPNPDEVLIKVYATTVSRTDCGMLRPLPPLIGRLMMGWFRPKYKILGIDFAGTIEIAGSDVTSFKRGDRVFGLSPESFGAHAEYLCVPADSALSLMPAGTEFSNMVVCEGAWYADTYLKKFNIKSGDRILIYGASGAIGTAAIQLAKYYGAIVTAVVSTRHMELAHSLGADQVVDYTAEDFTRLPGQFDFVLDAVGKTTFFRCRKLLARVGKFAATDLGPGWQNLLLAFWFGMVKSHRVVMPMPTDSRASVLLVKKCIDQGQFKAVIDRVYPFEKIVEAYRFVETAQKAGIVVIDV